MTNYTSSVPPNISNDWAALPWLLFLALVVTVLKIVDQTVREIFLQVEKLCTFLCSDMSDHKTKEDLELY